MQVGDKVKTSMGTGTFLGYECFDKEGRLETNWRIEPSTEGNYTTNRKVVKLDDDEKAKYLTNNIAYFFERETVTTL